jgi:methionine synthase I (cobalamin-dependent)
LCIRCKTINALFRNVSNNSEFFISAYPNAGLPNAFGQYDESPEFMAEQIREYAEKTHQYHWWLLWKLQNTSKQLQIW